MKRRRSIMPYQVRRNGRAIAAFVNPIDARNFADWQRARSVILDKSAIYEVYLLVKEKK